jgi:hypothetical protein
MVALEGGVEAPRVILRLRLELLDRDIPGAAQPYHTAAEMNLEDAQAFLNRCREATSLAAEHAIRQAIADLVKKGFQAAGGCVLLGSGRRLPDLQAILRAHPLLHTAEGELYREALRTGCTACNLPVCGVKEKEAAATAAQALGLTPDELARRIAEMGKLIGPPWRQDEKLSATGAWIVLAANYK